MNLKVILAFLASLLITTGAQAEIPLNGNVIKACHIRTWQIPRIRASDFAESGDATRAFNFLQDKLGKPHVDEVGYDFHSDLFHWWGPSTGKRMAMNREQFEKEILYPYYASASGH